MNKEKGDISDGEDTEEKDGRAARPGLDMEECESVPTPFVSIPASLYRLI